MKREIEDYKESLRQMVGEIYWESPPAMYLFQREYMSRDGALLFALEHCQFTDLFPRWFGNIIGNCPFIEARAYMIENMFVEEVKDPTIDAGHNESMWMFAKALGADERQIREYVPMVVTTMALHYFDNCSRTKPWLEAFAAIACLEMLTNAPLAARYGHIPGHASNRRRSSGSIAARCRIGRRPNTPTTASATTGPATARMRSRSWHATQRPKTIKRARRLRCANRSSSTRISITRSDWPRSNSPNNRSRSAPERLDAAGQPADDALAARPRDGGGTHSRRRAAVARPPSDGDVDLGGGHHIALFGSSTVAGIHAVAQREVSLAIVNPSATLTLAHRGTGPFAAPLPLRTIGVIPSRDEYVFAVNPRSGLSSFAEIEAKRPALRIGVRGDREHSLHFMLDDIMRANGFTRADIAAWGGEFHFEGRNPDPSSPQFRAFSTARSTRSSTKARIRGSARRLTPA